MPPGFTRNTGALSLSLGSAARRRVSQLLKLQLLLLLGAACSIRNVRVMNELSVSKAVAGKCESCTARTSPMGRTLPSLLTLHSKTTVPRLSMMTILKGGLHLRGSLGLINPIISSASQPARNVLVVYRLDGSEELLLSVSQCPLLVCFIPQTLLHVLRSTRRKLDLPPSNLPPGQLYGRIEYSYIAHISGRQDLFYVL